MASTPENKPAQAASSGEFRQNKPAQAASSGEFRQNKPAQAASSGEFRQSAIPAQLLDSLHHLPSLPAIVQDVIRSLDDPDMDAHALAEKIARDPGLTASILKVANSAFYGMSRQVASVQDAVIVLGFGSVRTLVLAAGFYGAFPTADGGFDRRKFWRRCFMVGEFAHALARSVRQDAEIAATAGLFLDIGQLVLDACLPKRYAVVLSKSAQGGAALIEAERAEFGFDRAEIGAEALERWNFPELIVRSVQFSRSPERTAPEPIQDLVAAADVLVEAMERGVAWEALGGALPDALRSRLNLPLDLTCLPEREVLETAADLVLA